MRVRGATSPRTFVLLVVVVSMAELYVLGELEGATSFGGYSLFCTYEFITGTQWSHIEGARTGTSHVMLNGRDGVVWSLPIDVHFAFQTVQGWPKIALQIWCVDNYGRKDLAGYGVAFVPLPTKDARELKIEVSTWKPTFWHSSGFVRGLLQFRQAIMGGNPVLRDETLIHSNDSRHKLYTVASGVCDGAALCFHC